MQKSNVATDDLSRQSLYYLGSGAAWLAVLVGIIEISINFLPSGRVAPETVIDWFALFQENWFMGLRNLGLLNIFATALSIPLYFALYAALQRNNKVYAALALAIAFIGIAVFYATNRAFAMLDLSRQYAAATTDTQRGLLAAAGQAMLSVGQSHTPGTFIGFAFSEIAGITISLVMLPGKVFSKATAYVGILGYGCLFIFEICKSFVPAFDNVALMVATVGGLLSLAWFILVAVRLNQLGKLNQSSS